MSRSQSMLWPLIGQELKVQLHQPGFIIFAIIAGLIGSFVMQNQPITAGVEVWGPFYIASSVVKLGFCLPAVIAFFTPKATLRVFQYNMVELTFSTPVSKFHWLLSRWVGLFSAVLLVYICFIAGKIIGLHFMDIASIDYGVMASAFFWPSALLILPAMLLATSLLFAVGLFSRSSLVIYITAGFAFIGYQTLLMLTGSPIMAQPILLSETLNTAFRMVDPLGASAFFEQVAHWDIAQRNTQHITLDNSLLINRALILLAIVVTLALTYTKFSLTLPTKKLRRAPSQPVNAMHNDYQPTASAFHLSAKCKAFISLFKKEYMLTIKTKSFALVIAFLAFVVGSEVFSGLAYLERLGVTPLPTTSIVVNRYMHDVIPNFGALFIAFFVAQIMWRDKEYDIAELIDTTPSTNAQFYAAKWLTIVCIPVTFITVSIIVASSIQLLFGGTPDISIYLSVFYYAGAPLVCLASLFLLFHSLISSKIIAMVLSFFITILAQSSLGVFIGIKHGMLRFGSTPALEHSQLLGFSATASAFNDYMMFWAALSLAFILLGFALFSRGIEISLSQRLSTFIGSHQKARGAITIICLCSLASIVLSGSHLFYQTNVIGQYKSSESMHQWRADYERKYIKYQDLVQPSITDVKNDVAFYPAKRRLKMSSTYQLTNRTDQAIKQILVSTHHLFTYSDVKVSNASLVSFDNAHKQYLWQLNTPLLAGESTTLSFKADYQQNGHNGIIHDNFLSEDFSYFTGYRYMPMLGYVTHYQLKSPQLRKEYNLAPLTTPLALEQDIAKHHGDFSANYMWTTTDITLSTVKGQTAIAPGELVKQWQDNERSYFHYVNKKPMRRVLTYFSFKHQKSSRIVDGINLEVYHRPQASDLAAEHLDAMADTVRYANKHFSPYDSKQLRLVEMPSLLGYSGFAASQTLLLDERYGFAVKRDNLANSFDNLYRRTLHETAHQWWGYALDSALTEGSSVLVETLTKLTEVLIMEPQYGKEYVRTLTQYEHDRYFIGRGRTQVQEKPLYRAGEKYLLYSKGSVAMRALVKRLGSQALTQTLSNLISNHHYPKPPATTLDFINLLKQQVPESEYDFIDSWLTHVTLDDWQITKQSLTENADGTIAANVCYVNQREYVSDQPVILDSRVTSQLVFFTKHPSQLFNKPIDENTLASITVTSDSQEQCVTKQLTQRPTYIAIDPYYLTLDSERENNLVALPH